MKKLFKIIFIILFLFTTVNAYSPTQNDNNLIITIGGKIDKLINGKNDVYKNKVIAQLETLKLKYSSNERIFYILNSVIDKYSFNKTTGIYYNVVSVVDGDTIKVNIDGIITTIRIIGIDTPEKYTTRTGYVECYGDEASKYATELLSGKKVRLEYDDTQDRLDKYGRTLAHVFLEDGTYYEELTIQNGYGFYYLFNKPAKYDEKLKLAEAKAKKDNAGVWLKCDGKREPIKDISDKTVGSVDSLLNNTGTSSSTTSNTSNNTTSTNSTTIPTGDYSCSISKTTCKQMSSCEEAKYYLNSCGIKKLDGDKDGTPCETLCK